MPWPHRWLGNPVLSAPNGARLDRALAQGLDFMVSIDNYINGTGGIFYPQSAVVPSRSGDIVVLGYGINDVRTGMTQATLQATRNNFASRLHAMICVS